MVVVCRNRSWRTGWSRPDSAGTPCRRAEADTMIADKNRIYDGWVSLEGGVDGGRIPSMIDLNQSVAATNMTFRGGDAGTRPGFRKLEETFPALFVGNDASGHTDQVFCYKFNHKNIGPDEILHLTGEYAATEDVKFHLVGGNWVPQDPWFANENTEYIYRYGTFQCAHAFSPHQGQDCIMALIGGRLFRIIPRVTDAAVMELVPKVDPPDEDEEVVENAIPPDRVAKRNR